MSNFLKIFLITLFSFQSALASSPHTATTASASDSTPFQIKIFDVGQGNCVAVKYNGKSMLIDCGSRSLGYTAQYHKTAGAGRSVTLSKDVSRKGVTVTKADSDDESSDAEEASKALSKATLHTPSPRSKLKAGVTPAREAKDSSSEDSGGEADKKEKDLLRAEYKHKVTEEIKEFLGDTIQAVIITHPDEDHYNLIPDVTAGKTVEKVIISSTLRDYSSTSKHSLEDFREWVEHYATEHKILSINEFYFSGKIPDHPIEQAIEFHSSTPGEPIPEIKILAMNATIEETRDPNADSIVLKIIYNGESILLPGDATERTWGKIKSTNPRNLKSDYFLISHHGAATHDSTTAAILDEIGAKAAFVSAGRYKGYCHPDRSVINMVLETSSLGEDEDLQGFVTYFSGKSHRRLTTRSLLFTTLNNGTITIDLGRSTAHTGHTKAPTQYHFEDKSFVADKNFAFKEQSISDPSNPTRLFSALSKQALGKDKVCFFKITEKRRGRGDLIIDDTKTHESARRTCEHAFLIKQNKEDEEIIIYLLPLEAEGSETTSETGGGSAAGAGSMKAASGEDKKKAASAASKKK